VTIRSIRTAATKARASRSPQLFNGEPQRRRLPNGFVVDVGPNTMLRDDGAALVGGSPEVVALLAGMAQQYRDGTRFTVCDDDSALLVRDLLDAGLVHPVAAELPAVAAADITVVIPVKDRPQELQRLLDAIGGVLATIVVDDGSDDPSATERVAFSHDARVVLLSENRGPGAARNAGLREVHTPFVIFIDSDVVVDPQRLLVLARHFADPAVGVVLPRVLGLFQGKDTNWLGRYEDSRSSLDLGEQPSFVHAGSVAPWAPGTCTVNRVDVIRDGFDEDMRVGEDVDIVFRIGLDGWRTRYDPSVVVWHDHRISLRPWFLRKIFYASSAHPLNARYPYYVVPSLLRPGDIAIGIAVLAQRKWSLPLIGAVTGVNALRTFRRLRAARMRHSGPVLTEPMVVSRHLAVGHLKALLLHFASLLVRQWWPAAAALSLISRRMRRAVLVAAVVDAVVFRTLNHADLDLPRYFVGRRLDDIGFGVGWWLSAWRARSVQGLLPDLRRPRWPSPRSALVTIVPAAK